jgi:glycosyltransferase involved in cell wall biosynthesis
MGDVMVACDRPPVEGHAVESPLVSALLPCLNEEETLGICIRKIKRAFADLGISGEVVVGDNGSTDRSVAIASELGARVAPEPQRGYGAAITAAAAAARGRYLVIADADDSYDWSGLGRFVAKLEEGFDFVMGNRFAGTIHPGAMPPLHRYLGNPVLSWVSRVFYDIPVHDFHCGMRAITREAWHGLRTETTGMEFATEMIVRAAQNGLRIAEIPCDLYPDKRSRPPHLRSFRDGWRHLRFIMTHAPNYLYLVPAALMMVAGAGLQAALVAGPIAGDILYLGPHFLALGVLLFLAGLSVAAIGVIAKVYLVGNSPLARDRVVEWLVAHFSLERGLLVGGALFLVGLALDIAILVQWLVVHGGMESSVHIAFFSTSLMVAGVLAGFSSFVLQMMLQDLRNRRLNGTAPTAR